MISKGFLREQRLLNREIEDVERAIANGEEVLMNILKQKILLGRRNLVEGLYELAIKREQRPSCLFVV